MYVHIGLPAAVDSKTRDDWKLRDTRKQVDHARDQNVDTRASSKHI